MCCACGFAKQRKKERMLSLIDSTAGRARISIDSAEPRRLGVLGPWAAGASQSGSGIKDEARSFVERRSH